MAIAYLNEGAVSLAAANWSDATGFANLATLVIASGSQTITTALDQSGLSGGIDTLDIGPQFTGRIGSPSTGPLKVDADEGGSTHRVTYNAGGGVLYLQAAGDNNLISNFWKSSPGAAYLMGGTFTNVILGEGPLSVNGSTVVTNAYLKGGNSTIEAGTAFTSLSVYAGTHYTKRDCATINVYGGTLIYDVPTTATTTTITVYSGATLRLLSSDAIATLNLEGYADFSQAKVGITIATANLGPLYKINESANVTITTRAAAGAKALRG